VITIELPGDPVPKGRPRFRAVTARNGRSFVNAYTPAKTRSYERALAMTAKVAMRGRPPLEGPLKVAVTAFLAVPSSWSNKKRDMALSGIIWPVGRPDADNFQKAAWDSLNSIVWIDDSQVVDARIVKTYAEQPSLRIEVQPLETMIGEAE
jgi:Holliday junction resolvase RusA-like endonuclease